MSSILHFNLSTSLPLNFSTSQQSLNFINAIEKSFPQKFSKNEQQPVAGCRFAITIHQ